MFHLIKNLCAKTVQFIFVLITFLFSYTLGTNDWNILPTVFSFYNSYVFLNIVCLQHFPCRLCCLPYNTEYCQL